MPVFEFLCPKCKEKKDQFLELKDYREPVYCECGKQMKKLVPHFDWKFGGVTARTDVELSTMSQEDSLKEFTQ